MTRKTAVLQASLAAAGITVSAWAASRCYKYFSVQLKRRALLQYYKRLLIPGPAQEQLLRHDFIQQLEDGLINNIEADGKHMLMLPTYVTQLPTGDETGDVYAIDLGGTNFRVMHVQLSEDRSQVASQSVHEVSIPPEVYTGEGTALFDFLAATLKEFIDQHGGCSSMKAGRLPVVGFCFSFAMEQSALNKGKLLTWTKGFTCSGVVGNDPVQLLSEALERAGRPCNITALLNDTVGVLAAQRYLDPDTSVGVIIGTGTNACYVETLGKLTKWQPGGDLPASTETAINIEWGAFESDNLPRCPEDWQVDAATAHPGKYLFEKLLSGMYLGDVARRILLRVAKESQLFGAAVPEALSQPSAFTTAHVAAIVCDRTRLLTDTLTALTESLGVSPSQAPYSARQVVQAVCHLVAWRSAKLVALALQAILTHAGWVDNPTRTTVAFDGGVYEKFGAYQAMLRDCLRESLGWELCSHVHFKLCHDGSCLGAAVLAAAAARS